MNVNEKHKQKNNLAMVNREYIQANGFQKDYACPDGVNRWEKQIGEGLDKNYWVSVTLSCDGKETLYGVINFYSVDNTSSRPHGYIAKHRYFNGPITIEDFDRFCDRDKAWVNRDE